MIFAALLLCILLGASPSLSGTLDDPLSHMYRSSVPIHGGGIEEDIKRSVFVLTLPRSGSTFVGNLFKQSKDFVYLFEATRGLGDVHIADNCATVPGKWEEDLVRSMFNCDFWSLRNYMDDLAKNKSHIYSWGFVQKHSSDLDILNKCFPGRNNDLPDAKRTKQSVAIKEITMWGPKLKWLYDTLGSELRIVWLVRDIRGWVSSWLPLLDDEGSTSFYEGWGMSTRNLWAPYDRCSGLQDISESVLSVEHLKTLKAYMSNISYPAHQRMAAWWTVENALLTHYLAQIPKENYMLIQYEHVSKYPVEVTQQLYEFMGKSVVPKDTMQWIFDNTASKEEGNEADRYGTSRDSEKMATVWRERLSDEELKEVERIGGPLFNIFDYTFADQI